MVAQAAALAPKDRRDKSMVLAALLAFCSPYPVRFAVEGKSYALLVLLVALGWWWRRRRWLPGYGLAVAAVAFTHFYGLFVFAAAVVWDGWRRRWGLMATAAVALLPSLAWIGYASAYLLSSRSGSWIGTPVSPCWKRPWRGRWGPGRCPNWACCCWYGRLCVVGGWIQPARMVWQLGDCWMPAV